MTATNTEASNQPQKQIFKLAAMNLNIFIIELSTWSMDNVKLGLKTSESACSKTFSLIEKTKKKALSPLLPRNSVIGKPFSPIGVGGLSAVIGVSGALFGHNGVVRPQVV